MSRAQDAESIGPSRRRKGVEHSGAAGEATGEFGYYVFGAWAKKDGTNVFCSCREASDANYFQLRCDQEDRSPSLEYLHDTIDWLRSKYKISDFLIMRDEGILGQSASENGLSDAGGGKTNLNS
jgi:hypothetical protein